MVNAEENIDCTGAMGFEAQLMRRKKGKGYSFIMRTVTQGLQFSGRTPKTDQLCLISWERTQPSCSPVVTEGATSFTSIMILLG